MFDILVLPFSLGHNALELAAKLKPILIDEIECRTQLLKAGIRDIRAFIAQHICLTSKRNHTDSFTLSASFTRWQKFYENAKAKMQESLRVACWGKVTSDVHGKQVNVPPCHTAFAVYTAFATFT